MKITLLIFLAAFLPLLGHSVTTIDTTNHYAYGANVGWTDCKGNTTNGAVLGQYVCSGFIYSANTGWINLGSGSPANGIRYQNTSSNDFGVNHDGAGNLTGYAWSGNIGWIQFEQTGSPKIDLRSGNLNGFAYSANCGWIGLSNSFAYVQTDSLSPGALDTNGLPVAWELTFFGHQGIDPNADADSDGMSNYAEYIAGTNPTNANSNFRIVVTSFSHFGTNASITWTSVSNRLYSLQVSTNLTSSGWIDSGSGLISSQGLTTSAYLSNSNAINRFYRANAIIPLR